MVTLQQHQEAWAAEFEREAARVRWAVRDAVDAVEHIGSTAVPWLVAKPIIDLAARAAPGVDPFSLGPALAPLGYEPHLAGPKNHGVYVRTREGLRTHILHVSDASAWEHCNQRLFRDKLLHDASARERYGRLKQSIADVADGREYTAAKRSLIEELLAEERADRSLPPATAWDK